MANLKKQSQFVSGRMGAKYFVKGDYSNKPACGAYKNKANSKPISKRCRGRFGWEARF